VLGTRIQQKQLKEITLGVRPMIPWLTWSQPVKTTVQRY